MVRSSLEQLKYGVSVFEHGFDHVEQLLSHQTAQGRADPQIGADGVEAKGVQHGFDDDLAADATDAADDGHEKNWQILSAIRSDRSVMAGWKSGGHDKQKGRQHLPRCCLPVPMRHIPFSFLLI